ncbi:hypothetical protein FACS189476_00650 [Spirochaetia bacterium]|nr:hypothetical protein FACS189476_00650 [Spirochaetia bacterium]
MNELIVKIFVKIISLEELQNIINSINFRNKYSFEIDILKNNDFDESKSKEYPDGFLYFPFVIEYFSNEIFNDADIYNTKIILEKLWENNFPAIAACDYENKLPENGGYNSHNIPWR